jgi:hypothetical protein
MAGEIVKFEQPQIQRRSFDEVSAMAKAIVESKLWGNTTFQQVVALMLMAEAEGRHVASAMQDYSVIQGKPSLKAEAMLARFQQAGGKVKWTCLTDERVAAIFSHAQCEPVEIDWDMERAKQAQLKSPMWAKYPRQMLRARVISEGVRTAFPGALGGMYAAEEVMEFEPPANSSRQAGAPALAPPREAEATAAGAVNANDAAPVAFHDQPSNVPGGFKSLKSIQVDEEQRTDHTTDPEWSVLSTDLTGNCESRSDVLAWWEARKKDLKQRKPHFAKAFYQGEVLPFAASFAQTVEWEDDAGARG